MDTEAIKQERVQVVLARAREIWPNETAEEWMHGSNNVLEGARPIDLVRRGRTDEVLAALEVERA
ncbi:antitoxin Xre/MbcA/ParS toxin-binding domain-containing protein [Kocuria sp. WRN011]|uniref:antitoxin Xre/MbcA/ParS toxin-binding domain-containing protein n=1 Tax=Kocuria sp. WRN011 TaxID=2029858 RepID=UPI00117A698D|nr:antitoxin Xre/MbcA/ParS toxin-binding domain-containing protein [Kocuria sp. WRN011]